MHRLRLAATVVLLLWACACGPPNLRIDGVGPVGGPWTLNPFVPPDVTTDLEAHLVNDGGQGTSAPALSFAPLSCLALEADYVPDDIDGVSAGEAIVFPLAITPTGCDIATIVDWFLEADGLKFRGTFNVNLER